MNWLKILILTKSIYGQSKKSSRFDQGFPDCPGRIIPGGLESKVDDLGSKWTVHGIQQDGPQKLNLAV